MGNKAHLRPHRKKRQARRTTGLLLLVLFIALVALATAVAASGHAILPAGRIIPLRGAVVVGLQGACPSRARSGSRAATRAATPSHGTGSRCTAANAKIQAEPKERTNLDDLRQQAPVS